MKHILKMHPIRNSPFAKKRFTASTVLDFLSNALAF
jgi:hypothetical protein